MVYRMIFNQTAYFGRGAIKEIPGVARSHGFTKAFIVTDPVLLETGTVKKVTDVLDEAGMPYEVFDNVKPNPPVECIQDGVAKFAASGADFLIGLGGGSPQDTCKGIGIVTANPEFADVLSLEGVADTKNPSVPIFGVPTTAGTASETTIDNRIPVVNDLDKTIPFMPMATDGKNFYYVMESFYFDYFRNSDNPQIANLSKTITANDNPVIVVAHIKNNP